MITLHRLGHNAEPFLLNPDLILTVEATPDTVVTLTTGTRFVVVEPPARVADAVRRWRTEILQDALSRRRDQTPPARSAMAAVVAARQERTLAPVDALAEVATEERARPVDNPER